MTTLEAIDRLIEAVEAGTCPLRLITDAGIYGSPIKAAIKVREAFNGSLDASKALHEALLPGWEWGRTEGNIYVKNPTVGSRSTKWGGPNANPARAWLLAILRAHRHQIAAGGE